MTNEVIGVAVEGAKLISGAMAYHSSSKIGSTMARTFLRTAPRIFETRKQAQFACKAFGMGIGCAASIAVNESIDEAYDGFKAIKRFVKKHDNKHNAKTKVKAKKEVAKAEKTKKVCEIDPKLKESKN